MTISAYDAQVELWSITDSSLRPEPAQEPHRGESHSCANSEFGFKIPAPRRSSLRTMFRRTSLRAP
jgi:hypothetical protein